MLMHLRVEFIAFPALCKTELKACTAQVGTAETMPSNWVRTLLIVASRPLMALRAAVTIFPTHERAAARSTFIVELMQIETWFKTVLTELLASWVVTLVAVLSRGGTAKVWLRMQLAAVVAAARTNCVIQSR